MTLFNFLIYIVLPGGFGGFVFGLFSKTQLILKLPWNKQSKKNAVNGDIECNASWPTGFLGDISVGIAAAIAIILFYRLFGLENVFAVESLDTNALMMIMSISVIAGFAGKKILDALLNKILKQVEDLNMKISEVKIENEKQMQKNEKVLLGKMLMDYGKHLGTTQAAQEPFSLARKAFNEALSIDPNFEVSQKGLELIEKLESSQ